MFIVVAALFKDQMPLSITQTTDFKYQKSHIVIANKYLSVLKVT